LEQTAPLAGGLALPAVVGHFRDAAEVGVAKGDGLPAGGTDGQQRHQAQSRGCGQMLL
jgi:hypothetical protein